MTTSESTLLQTDDNGHAIPVLRYFDGGAHNHTKAAESTVEVEFDEETKVITLETTGKISFRLGGADVRATAADHTFLYPRVDTFSIADPISRKQEYSHISVYFHENATIAISERR